MGGTKDVVKVCKKLGENWNALAEDEKAVFEARAKAAMEDYEKAKGEYENRPDVKEYMAKERAQKLKVEVAAAAREVVKATAQLEFLQNEFEAAKKDLEDTRERNKVVLK